MIHPSQKGIWWTPFRHALEHKNMKWIFSQEDLNIQKFNFKIPFKPRRENLTVDALSRKNWVLTITIVSNPIIEVI